MANKLWNTGVNAPGMPLPPGSTDPHSQLIQGPGIAAPQDAVVLANQRFPTYFKTADSMWSITPFRAET